ncbi:unnamed protein product (macronuclear) [Paramecium tetraurelia]|uniref:Dynein heavy chain n=1 Tax=Paramecium tetraurelia TaxID=5888 RepID=A0CWH1_PARTE|nr:uncharacterized protein GSPATT00001341001 [Paramecium tetraurelia]CAK75138.1 unnamed protein product [Paramecium tetraurelia]|eukprot:XP_001442535.1 hypothetical protein (macronuclear) [Paramecium tetraurelia strain d4-2]
MQNIDSYWQEIISGVPVTPGLNLTQFLVDDATVGEWNLQGLPKDELSIQNGIMVTNSTRYPLLIDPQGQGNYWIRQKFADKIEPFRCITTLNHPKFKDNFLKPCMQDGLCLIIENIENEVDPMLDPVLEKQIQVKAKKNKYIEVGGTQMDFDDGFKLFMFCRLANPTFSPELSAKTTIIDFTVTQGGLEQQLLGKVISKEQKALEDSLNQLLADVNQNKKDLQRLDKNLLERLTQSSGNLLEDEGLIEVLGSTKTQAKEVSVKLLDAEVKTREINEKREQYRPVAIRGSALYFTILEVSLINWMYNSSLEQFLKLFNDSIDQSERNTLPSKRVDNIIKYLTFHVYKYVNRGLFEKDKISFILMMCFKVKQTDKKINAGDVSQFLKSGAALDPKTEKQKPFQFLDEKQWLNILALSRHHFNGDQMAFFRDLPESISRNEQQWRQWNDRNDPENSPIPDFAERIAADKEIGPFISLCLVRSLKEDRTLVAATHFINATLGKEFTAPISYPIDSIWAESSKTDPVLFLLSAGADPTSSIDDLSRKKRKVFCEKVSMGEGQEEAARRVIKNGFETGMWVILQNCHLGLKFMEEIETIVNPEATINDDFRLWITCEQHPKFPLGLLQKTIKVTNEPPKGLKAGLYKTFTTIITQEFLEKVEHPNWRSLIYTICFLHSIVIERRKFGPLGWCVPYEFNNPDLEASLAFIEKYLNSFLSGPPSQSPNLNLNMNVIRYMICEVQYGGRITDDLDRELFNAYGEDYLKEAIFGNEYVIAEAPFDAGGGTKPTKFQYKIPATTQMPELIKYHDVIKQLPDIDNPEVFGLHVNADITFRKKESTEMIITIMDTRPKDSGGGGGKTREEIVQDKARELLAKLPSDYVDLEVREQVRKLAGPKNLPDKGLTVPLNIFLYQEIQRMQIVIAICRKTLSDVIDAIDGQIIMTPDILEAINSMYDAKVPLTWVYDATGVEISWILPTLGAWFSSLIDRNKQLNDWLKSNRPNHFWLGGFFNPQGFLTAVKQEVTRMHKGKPGDKDAWSLDDVVQSTQVKEREYEQIRDIQSEGVYVSGLSLEGCKWSRNGLDESEPKKMFAPLPILYVTAINKKKGADAEKNSSTYSCPVYKYPRRTDKYLICRVGLPCEGTGAHKWKLRGVALLCSTE